MSYRDYPDARVYEDRDIYGPGVYDRSAVKRERSLSPYDREEAYRAWAASKRARSREEYNASPAYGGASPPRRSWDQLDREEKEREWARYEREREWDRYRAREYEGEDQYREASYRADYDDRHHYADYDRAREQDARSSWPAAAPKARPMDPMDSTTILPFRKYAQALRELGTEPCALATGPEATQELYGKYQEYRVAHSRKTMKQFWEAHKADKWFVEKYGISEEQVEKRRTRKRMGREGRKKVWLQELRDGKLDKVCWDLREDTPGVLATTSRLGEEELLENGETVNVGPEANQIMVRQIPPEIGREEIEDVLLEEPGFRYLALGEPQNIKKWARMGWAQFEDSDGLPSMVESLNQKLIAGQRLAFEIATRPAQGKLKIATEYFGSLKRMSQDLQTAKEYTALLQKEDVEELWADDKDNEAIQANASEEIEQRCLSLSLISSDGTDEATKASIKKRLDMHIDLLREVYHCDFYSATQCDFPEELARRTPKHLRRVSAATTAAREEPSGSEAQSAKNLDNKHKLLLRPNDNAIGELGGTALDKMMLDLVAPYSQEDGEEKHRCTVVVNGKECSKPFKAQIFVQKHVLNKHKDFAEGIVGDQAIAARYFNNYVRDPQRVAMPISGSGATITNGREATNGHGSAPSLSARISHEAIPMHGSHSQVGGGGASNGGFYGSSGLIRMGGLTTASGSNAMPSLDSHHILPRGQPPSLSARLSAKPANKIKAEPLPSDPRPLDPRAALAPKRYEDLDAGGGPESGEIELEY